MANKVNVEFTNGFNGVSTNESGSTLNISFDQWRPYELLFTALASCMYSTFLDVIDKKKLEYDKVSISVDGEKVDDVPTFLKKAEIVFTVSGAEKDNEKVLAKFDKSLKLSEKYCSIYNTITKIAELNAQIIFT